MSKVRNVVFDVGNILLRWDPRNLYRKIFSDPAAMEQFLETICTSEWNLQGDMGRSWRDLTEELVVAHPAHEANIRAYRSRWHEMVIGSIDENVRLLETFKRNGVPLYAITNFSADCFAESQERFPFLKTFDGIICSGVERVVKPDPAIYRLLLDRYGLQAAECVFIDDSEKNIIAASKIGFKTIHYGLGVDSRLAFAQFGLPVD
ncbi:MAG TPA: HAD family phosphatase [Beijerinckiaceae bacterium]|nr:HAD family phosphatase [Beijerinckiaceae bacterium]